MVTDADRKLRNLLGPPARPVDRAFVNRVDLNVAFDLRMRRAKALGWRRFWKDLLISLFVVGGLLALVGSGNSIGRELAPVMSPVTFALFLFGIWAAAALKPSYSNA
ncbi:MAG TPA: hypothetical protein VGB70_04005 [Allosphingosinicella sp.]|jgi:hypothetical protein